MKLILHIGTPKTGTTALQQSLFDSRDELRRLGVHYASPTRAIMANTVANALSVGDTASVGAFFLDQAQAAARSGAHTMVVSSENFYGMTAIRALDRRQACPDAVGEERVLVRMLRSLMPDGIEEYRVVCYLRRPDRLAESLYNQQVKRDLFDLSFSEFLRLFAPAVAYQTCISVWSDVFGKESCTVRGYEAAERGIVEDFTSYVLKIGNESRSLSNRGEANERISRDLLEFKLGVNKTARRIDRDVEYRILRALERKLRLQDNEPAHYQDFFSPAERVEFLAELAAEIDALAADYELPTFPPLVVEDVATERTAYPGLTQKRRDEIRREYEQIRRRPAFLFERSVTRGGTFVRRHFPMGDRLLRRVSATGAKRALLALARRGRREEAW